VVYPKTGYVGKNGVNELWHRRRAAEGGWSAETMASAPGIEGTGAALAIDGRGRAHLVWAEGAVERTLRTRTLDASGFGDIRTISDGGADRAYYLGLGIDACDTLHVAFRRMVGANADVFHASGRDGAFTVERLTETPDVDESVAALAVSPKGDVAIAWGAPTSLPAFELKLATFR
jgi:hypothetical protein